MSGKQELNILCWHCQCRFIATKRHRNRKTVCKSPTASSVLFYLEKRALWAVLFCRKLSYGVGTECIASKSVCLDYWIVCTKRTPENENQCKALQRKLKFSPCLRRYESLSCDNNNSYETGAWHVVNQLRFSKFKKTTLICRPLVMKMFNVIYNGLPGC